MTAVTETKIEIQQSDLEALLEKSSEKAYIKVLKEFGLIPEPTIKPEIPLNLTQAAEFLGLKPSTIYGLTHRGEISFTKKGKKLLFYANDLKNYLDACKQKSKRDLANEVEEHLGKQGENKKATT